LNPVLYPLYIENSTKNPQLDDLLRLEDRGIFTNHFKKIIFQYYYLDDNNGFTLTAYIGPTKQHKFESKGIQFSSYTTSCGKKYKENSPDVFLSDFEFVDQKAAIKKLQSLAEYYYPYPVNNSPDLSDHFGHLSKTNTFKPSILRTARSVGSCVRCPS
jgi:hypothetical protein